MGGVAKSFLYAWCGKNKVVPCYRVKPTGDEQRQIFLCEVTVPGFVYLGVGHGTNKKCAQTNAAKDFLLFLVKAGHLSKSEIPVELPAAITDEVSANLPSHGPLASHIQLSSSEQNYSIQNSYAPFNQNSALDYVSRIEEQRTEEAEDLDINSSFHGNWNLVNAKCGLNRFSQMCKTYPLYTYSQVGPNHKRFFQCELSLYVKELGQTLCAKECGSTKQMASKLCALSLIQQLYHLEVIEAYTELTKKKETDTLSLNGKRHKSDLNTDEENVLNSVQPSNPRDRFAAERVLQPMSDNGIRSSVPAVVSTAKVPRRSKRSACNMKEEQDTEENFPGY